MKIFLGGKIMLLQYFPNREVSISARRQIAPRGEKKVSRVIMLGPGGSSASPLLDLASQPSQTPSRKSFRRRKLTKAARHRILKHAALLSPENKSRQVFLTGTLPGSTELALSEFCRLAPYLVKMFQTYLPRLLGISAKEMKYCWVWEQQKRGALHLHCVIELPDRHAVKKIGREWSGLWNRLLRVVGKKARCDIFARRGGGSWAGKPEVWQSDCQVVKKRVDKYLSKYVGKGEGADSRYFPPRWYGISTRLRDEMKDWMLCHTVHVPFRFPRGIEVGDMGEYLAKELSGVVNGTVGSRRNWSEPHSFWRYFYLGEDYSFEDVVMTVYASLGAFGDIDAEVATKNDFYKKGESEMKKFRQIMKREWPTWFYYDVIGRMPEPSRIKFVNDDVLGSSEFMDLELAFGYSALAGYGNDALNYEWISECRQLLEMILGTKQKDKVL